MKKDRIQLPEKKVWNLPEGEILKKKKKDNFLRGGTLTQENNSKDKRDRRC